MSKQDTQWVVHLDLNEKEALTLEEICEHCQVSADFIQEMIAHGIIEPEEVLNELRFTPVHIKRTHITLHLQNDLEINLPGIALVLELMDELESLRARLNILEKYSKE